MLNILLNIFAFNSTKQFMHSKFPASFKFANIIPVFKQSSRNQKKT